MVCNFTSSSKIGIEFFYIFSFLLVFFFIVLLNYTFFQCIAFTFINVLETKGNTEIVEFLHTFFSLR